jgi:hypothetical protein
VSHLTLFTAKQRALRFYQLYDHEFVEITPDQRDGCLAPSDRTGVYLMRQESQNDRQLRWALKVYWRTQKEDAARAGQSVEEAQEVDELLEALEQSLCSTSLRDGEQGRVAWHQLRRRSILKP